MQVIITVDPTNKDQAIAKAKALVNFLEGHSDVPAGKPAKAPAQGKGKPGKPAKAKPAAEEEEMEEEESPYTDYSSEEEGGEEEAEEENTESDDDSEEYNFTSDDEENGEEEAEEEEVKPAKKKAAAPAKGKPAPAKTAPAKGGKISDDQLKKTCDAKAAKLKAGRKPIVALLQKFKVSKLVDLPQEKRAKFLEQVNALK